MVCPLYNGGNSLLFVNTIKMYQFKAKKKKKSKIRLCTVFR